MKNNKIDSNGLKQGLWKTYFNNNLFSIGYYIDNKKDGWWKFYFNNKTIKQGRYLEDEKIGLWIFEVDGGFFDSKHYYIY